MVVTREGLNIETTISRNKSILGDTDFCHVFVIKGQPVQFQFAWKIHSLISRTTYRFNFSYRQKEYFFKNRHHFWAHWLLDSWSSSLIGPNFAENS